MLTRAPRPHTGGAAVSYVPDGPFVTSPRTYARALGPRRVDRLHLPLPLPGKATIESAPHRAADACCGGWPGLAWPPSSGTDQPPDCGEVSKASQPASSRGGRVWQRPNCRRPVRCVCVPAPPPLRLGRVGALAARSRAPRGTDRVGKRRAPGVPAGPLPRRGGPLRARRPAQHAPGWAACPRALAVGAVRGGPAFGGHAVRQGHPQQQRSAC
jgi:hypothetical protein